MGTRGGETQDTERHSLTLLTLRVGALETSRDPETGQEASRAAPVLGVVARGSGEPDGTSRGSGELDGTSRGSGELDGTSRGTGELDGASRGS